MMPVRETVENDVIRLYGKQWWLNILQITQSDSVQTQHNHHRQMASVSLTLHGSLYLVFWISYFDGILLCHRLTSSIISLSLPLPPVQLTSLLVSDALQCFSSHIIPMTLYQSHYTKDIIPKTLYQRQTLYDRHYTKDIIPNIYICLFFILAYYSLHQLDFSRQPLLIAFAVQGIGIVHFENITAASNLFLICSFHIPTFTVLQKVSVDITSQ